MKIETGRAERPVIIVPVCGLEITSPFYAGGVPEAATEVGEERKFRP